MTILVLSLYSCIHDDMLQNTTEYSSKEYISKSPWNEDEVYIKKVQQVFLKHANLQYFNNRYGEAYWDYSMSFGQFGERFALIPVVKENKVVLILEAIRKGKKLYFYEKTDENYLQFFNYLLFSPTSGYKETNGRQSTTAKLTYTCTTKTFIVECTDAMPNCTPLTSTLTNCELTGTGPSTPKASLEEPPMGGGGGSGDDGYEYTDPPVETPCELMKTLVANENYMKKIDSLGKNSILSRKKETGFSENKSGVFTNLIPAPSTDNSDGLKITITSNTKGYTHTHLNDYDTGKFNSNGEPVINQPIRMFSPADVNTLMTMAGFVTDGDYSQLYGTMVSSYGNYTIRFTGTTTDIKTGFDTEQWRLDYLNYRKDNKYWSFEKLFLNFLKDKMNIQGIELYKIKNNGIVQKKTLNSNNNVDSNNCP